jgi:hypothetical protein
MCIPLIAACFVLVVSAVFSQPVAVTKASEVPISMLQRVIKDIDLAEESSNTAEIRRQAFVLRVVMNEEKFSLSEDLPQRLQLIKGAAIALANSGHIKGEPLPTSQDEAILALEAITTALSTCIDAQWKHEPVSPNVIPPPGTPNASIGMNPDAIHDRNLRQQYLDLINTAKQKNLKNLQQSVLREALADILTTLSRLERDEKERGWGKADIQNRFAKHPFARGMLREIWSGGDEKPVDKRENK